MRRWIGPGLLGLLVFAASLLGFDGWEVIVVAIVAFLIGFVDGDTDHFRRWGSER